MQPGIFDHSLPIQLIAMNVFCKQSSLLHVLIAVVNALSRDYMTNTTLVQIFSSMKIPKMLMAVTNRTTTKLLVDNVLFKGDFYTTLIWQIWGKKDIICTMKYYSKLNLHVCHI